MSPVMTHCIAVGCSNNSSKQTPGISFHRFPKKDQTRRLLWLANVRRENLPRSENSLILCSDHFEPDCFVTITPLKASIYTRKAKDLKPDAVPTLFTHDTSVTPRKCAAKCLNVVIPTFTLEPSLSHTRQLMTRNANCYVKRLKYMAIEVVYTNPMTKAQKEMLSALFNPPKIPAASQLCLDQGTIMPPTDGSAAASNLSAYQGNKKIICNIENFQKTNSDECVTVTSSLPNLVKTELSDENIDESIEEKNVLFHRSSPKTFPNGTEMYSDFPSNEEYIHSCISQNIAHNCIKNLTDDIRCSEGNTSCVTLENVGLNCREHMVSTQMSSNIKQSWGEKMSVSPSQSTVQKVSTTKKSINTSKFKTNSSNKKTRQFMSRTFLATSKYVHGRRLKKHHLTTNNLSLSRTSDTRLPNQRLDLATVLIPSLPSLSQSHNSLSINSPPTSYITFKPLIKVEQSEEKIHQESWIDKVSAEEGLISTITIEKVSRISDELQTF